MIVTCHCELWIALGERATLVTCRPRQNIEWDITSVPPQEADSYDLVIGVLLNTKQAFRVLEVGPPADQPETEQFR